jgi:hypothetical protein
MKYIIDFKDELTLAEVDQYLTDHNIIKIRRFDNFGHVLLVSSDNVLVVNDFIEEVILDEDNAIKLLNLDITLVDSNVDTQFNTDDEKNWWKVASINNIDFDQETYTCKVRGQGNTVYILDSGIQVDHPEFVDTDITLLHSIVPGDFTDYQGHGTAIASVISGKTCGLTGAKIKVVKVFDMGQGTLQSDLLAAFDAVLTDYIATGKTMSVVNLSWGIAKNDYINAKIEQMIDQGLYIVAAAGNSGVPIDDITPASIPRVLTLGAYDQELKPCDFSNYTGESTISVTGGVVNHGALDGWAPGNRIWAATKNSEYGFASGTSIAAGIASGSIVYNMARYTVDGQGPDIFVNYQSRLEHLATSTISSDVNQTPFHGIAISKPNLLDLSDPKYVNSINKVVNYYTQKEYTFPTAHVEAHAEKVSHKSIFSNIATARVVCTSNNLPDFITISNTGIVTIDAPAIEEGKLYEKLEPVTFDTYQRDGSTGTVILTITILRSDINKQNASDILPPDDPLLDLMLYSCFGFACDPSCQGSFCQYFSSGKSFFCSC